MSKLFSKEELELLNETHDNTLYNKLYSEVASALDSVDVYVVKKILEELIISSSPKFQVKKLPVIAFNSTKRYDPSKRALYED
jgi:hypothetical protein